MIWFTSDTHYNHSNICLGTSRWDDKSELRPFQTLQEHNDVLVHNINSNIHEDDTLFHLGDFSFGGFDSIEEFRNRIICRNLHIITGNHDHHIENNKKNIQNVFTSVQKYLELEISESRLILMHFPISSWNNLNKGAIHLHGHIHFSHEKKFGNGKMLDVGVDGNNYKPYSLQEIFELMNDRPIKSQYSIDRHENKP